MKGLDTSVLLGLLEEDPAVRKLLGRLRGVELATTEANLLELELLAAHGSGRHRRARRLALERLRRKITVLPIDSRAIDQVGSRLAPRAEPPMPTVLAMLGALESNGCDELFVREALPIDGRWKLRITSVE